tara:strand:+ start:28402 stop:29256 length:855 start_codon:yes stop_codon:yes gene_type:complete
MIRVIAIDIDGTLLDSQGQMPDENRKIIKEASVTGIHIILATGRCFHHAKPVSETLLDKITLIVNNGALVKTGKGITLNSTTLSRDLAREVINSTKSLQMGTALVFDRTGNQQYLFENIDWKHPNRFDYFKQNARFMTEISPLEKGLTEDPLQIAFNGSVNEMRRLRDYLHRQPNTSELCLTITEYKDRDFSLLDITAKNCSKGNSLATWCNSLGINADQVMAIGDNLNDLDMLMFAGLPIIMGNAVKELKSYGWKLTESNDNGGLANAIRAFALNKQVVSKLI